MRCSPCLLAIEKGAWPLKKKARRLMQILAAEEDSLLRCGAKPPSVETSQNIWNKSLLETLCLTCFKAGQWTGLPCEGRWSPVFLSLVALLQPLTAVMVPFCSV